MLAGALKAYDKAVELHRRAARAKPLANGFGSARDAAEEPPPPPAGPPVRLLNNAAVLHLRYGNLSAALPLMEEAVQASRGCKGQEKPQTLMKGALAAAPALPCRACSPMQCVLVRSLFCNPTHRRACCFVPTRLCSCRVFPVCRVCSLMMAHLMLHRVRRRGRLRLD